MSQTRYGDEFYLSNERGSGLSASRVVPVFLEVIAPRSVVDVGCGIGTWSAAFRERGITDIVGVDGAYVNRRNLRIDPGLFLARDLEEPLAIGRKFDLAVCVEVAEHLPESRSDGFVSDLVSLAPAVLFSAAIPRQGGHGHVNEQWPDYWERKFQRHGYVTLDFIRSAIWDDDAVEWWYRQNIVLYAHASYVRENPALARIAGQQRKTVLRLVHPRLYEFLADRVEYPSVGELLRGFAGALGRSIRYRLGRSRREDTGGSGRAAPVACAVADPGRPAAGEVPAPDRTGRV
jgi:SAM-dependent methyltransferase